MRPIRLSVITIGMASGNRRIQTRIRRRRFCLTLNNPTAAECVQWQTVLTLGNEAPEAADLTFFVVQTEKGDGSAGDSTEGTIHYQGYIEFKKGTEWSSVKKIFGDRIHLENAKANAAANIRYCTKNRTRYIDGDICISGQWGHAKKGGNVMMAAIKILNGAKKAQIVDEHPALAMMHMPRIESFIAEAKGPRTEAPKVTILYGITGCGKSRYCFETFGTEAYWVPPPDSGRVWWGHYTGQDVAIFDDFHEKWFDLVNLLRIIDRYPLQVAPKGGQVPFNSGHLVFTSNVDPKDWYSGYEGDNAHKDALQRRIRDFAEIIDCSQGTTSFGMGDGFPIYIRTKRTELFTFRDQFGMNFNTAGVGDMSQGNGFNN